MEAGKAQGLFPGAIDPDAGMNMSGECESLEIRISVQCFRHSLQVMPESKFSNLHFFRVEFDIAVAVNIFVKNIVIASHQVDFQLGKIFSPFAEQSQFLVGLAVEHISHNNQPLRAEELQQAHQSLQVPLEHGLWNSDARFPEMPGFSKMQVGYNQGSFLFPIQAALRRDPESLALQFIFEWWMQ